MKNFITWLSEKMTEEDGIIWDKEDVCDFISEIHQTIISDEDKPWMGKHYGDCTKENVSCRFCMYQSYLDEYETYCKNQIKLKYESNS